MKRRALVLGMMVGLWPLGLLPSCVLVNDTESLDAGCPSGQKECDGECVSTTNPNYGCGSPNCAPCALPRALARCSDTSQACAISACVGSWANCDDNPDNGCEVNVDVTVEHCGRCNDACEDPPDAEAACGSSNCYVRKCTDGMGNCDLLFDNGCEVDLSTSLEHCGACNRPCATACIDGSCTGAPAE